MENRRGARVFGECKAQKARVDTNGTERPEAAVHPRLRSDAYALAPAVIDYPAVKVECFLIGVGGHCD